jgi:DNA-binding NarL/FixJ family response regulator
VPPLIICDDAEMLARAHRQLVREGWTVRAGWEPPARLWDAGRRLVLEGSIETPRDAAAALNAAVHGIGVLAHAGEDGRVVERFFDDLCRLGPVECRSDARDSRSVPLDRETTRLLTFLREGLSVGEAARRVHISRRTADRRLAAARALLGVDTTAEAIVHLQGR